jgi:6-pyruvoyltetrahydropterin/6-carboxytetrahydropterin synthase
MSNDSSIFEATVEASFSAAHHLRDYEGKCANNHGHNFRVRVTVEGQRLDGAGMLIDFSVLKRWLREICESMDHQSLNDLRAFADENPTTENIAAHVAREMCGRVAEFTGTRVRVQSVWVQETDTNSAVFRPGAPAAGSPLSSETKRPGMLPEPLD